MSNLTPAQQRAIRYAREREWRHLTIIQKADAEIVANMHELLLDTMDQLRRECEAWYARYADIEGITVAQARQAASDADIDYLARKAKYYVEHRDDDAIAFSDEADRYMRLYNFSMKVSRHEWLIRRIELALYELADDVNMALDTWLTDMTLTELERQAGLLGLHLPGVEALRDRARVIARASFHNETFSQRIWRYQEGMRKILEQGIRQSIIMGKNPTTWMRTLEPFLRDCESNMDYALKRLAVTESGRVQIESQRQSYIAAGFDHYIVICEPTACPVCLVHDGSVYKVKEMKQGVNAPMFHPNCHCTTSSYYDREDLDENIIKSVKNTEKLNKEKEIRLIIEDKQFGKKARKHMKDFKLNPANEEDRNKYKAIIEDIVYNSDEIINNLSWRGQKQLIKAYIKDDDVVLVNHDDKFISILKGGINNARIKNARK